MRALFQAFIAVGSVAAAITGTTVAVKKNETCGKAYEQHAPKLLKKSCTFVETKVVSGYRKTASFLFKEAVTVKAGIAAIQTAEFKKLKADHKRIMKSIVQAAITQALAAQE